MYEKYFGLKEKAFNITPDPAYFFPSSKHQAALDSLLYAISDRRGFIVITGEIGSGKTITCRTLLAKLDRSTKVAVITNTFLTNKQLMANVLEEFGVSYTDGDKYHLLKQLNSFLLEQHELGNSVVLVIDEAQNLSRSVLEEIRMLSNLETEKDKLIQIILLGQPEMREKLRMKSLEQLRQRISLHYHLGGLDKAETAAYVRYRLHTAKANGASKDMLFTDDALQAVYDHTGGIPRMINIVCDNALVAAFAHDYQQVTPAIIEDAIKDNDLFRNRPESSPEQ